MSEDKHKFVTDRVYFKTYCNHCGFDVRIQPPESTGCHHTNYPENCSYCADRSRVQVKTYGFDIGKITHRAFGENGMEIQ